MVNFFTFLLINVLFDHLVRDVARGNRKVAPRPKVASPEDLSQVGKFGEDLVRTLALDALGDRADGTAGRVGKKEMNMIGGYLAGDDFNILSRTDFADHIPNLQPDHARKYLLSVLRDKDEMNLQITLRVGAGTIESHRDDYLTCSPTEFQAKAVA